MTPSQQALHYYRCADWAEEKALKAARSNDPWALGNLRLYQNEMVKWLERRNAVIQNYLNERFFRGTQWTPAQIAKMKRPTQ